MHFVIAGSSGFLGTRLLERLIADGHTTTRLVRRPGRSGESTWDPAAGTVDADVIEEADVVVNLAGSPTMGNPHSKKWATNLRNSRVTSTRTLAEAIAASDRKPAFLAGNAIAYYSDHGNDVVTEATGSLGHNLLTEVSRVWQQAAQPAIDAGARVCILRTTPVLDRRSQPLKAQTLLFKLGLGGPIGKGDQYFPVISTRDWVSAVVFLARHDDISGPVNLCIPEPATNAEFTRALAREVKRPAFFKVPAPLVRIAASRMAPEVLGSVRAVPKVLLDAGFEFADPSIRDVLASGLRAI